MTKVGNQKLRTLIWEGREKDHDCGTRRKRTPLLFFNGIGANIEAVAPGDKSDQFDMGGLAIEEFTTNLTETAYNGNLDPVVGRDDEISRVIQILARLI